MRKIDIIQTVILVLIVIVVVMSIGLFFREFYRQPLPAQKVKGWLWTQVRSLVSLDSIWVMLCILLALYVASAVAFALLRNLEKFFDYVAFAAPCVAAILVGLGLLERVRRQRKKHKRPLSDYVENVDVWWYFISLFFLYLALAGYLGAHFGILLVCCTATAFVVLCLIAYFVLMRLRESRETTARLEVAAPFVGSLLGALAAACVFFIVGYYPELRREEAEALKHNECCDEQHGDAQSGKDKLVPGVLKGVVMPRCPANAHSESPNRLVKSA